MLPCAPLALSCSKLLFCSFRSTWCFAPLVWPSASFLLLDLVFHSFCSTYCSTLLLLLDCFAFLVRLVAPLLFIAMLFLLNLLFCYFFLTCYLAFVFLFSFSVPLVRPIVPFLFVIPLLLFNLLFHFSYLTIPLLLLDLLVHSPCWTCCSIPLTNLFAHVPFCYACDFVTPCYFCLMLLLCYFCFKLILPVPFYLFCRCGMWKSCPNLNFSS